MTTTGETEKPVSSEPARAAISPVWVAGAVAIAGLTFAWAWNSGAPAQGSKSVVLPVIAGPLPEFSLKDSEGRDVTLADLKNNIWVANFIFTRCAGPCPKLSERMRAVQYALADYPANVKLISLSLDPETDTPPVLKRYAKRFNADADRWRFLTNDDETVMHRLIAKGFLQSVIPATDDAPLIHSNYFVVVDGQGRIRACHDGNEAATKEAVLEDIDSLLAERSAS